MRKLTLIVTILALLMMGAIPALAQDDTGANLRVAHLSFDAGEVDVYINGDVSLSNAAFGDVSPWTNVPAGTYNVAVAPAGTSIDDAVIGPLELTLEKGEWYTVAAVGLIGDDTLTAQVITEDYSDITPAETRLTIFHAIPNAGPVSVLADDALLVAGLGYPGSQGDNDGAATVDVVADTYDITVQLTEGSEDVIFDLPETELTANRNYFIAASGLAEESELVFVSTNPADPTQTMGETEEMTNANANLRVAHFAEDAPAVDVYINGELSSFTGIEYPALSDFISVPAGTYSVAVAPANTSLEDAVIGPLEVTVEGGEWYTVAAIGLLERPDLAPLQAQVLVEDYSDIAVGEARFTVFHASPGAPPVDLLVDGQVFAATLAYPGTLDGNDGAVTFDVIAGTYDIQVTANGDPETVLLDLSGTELSNSHQYFIAAINTPDNLDTFIQSETR